MEIDFEDGQKCEKDRIIQITTEENEAVTIFKIALLLNQLGINEQTIRTELSFDRDLFDDFFKGVLNHIKSGIDWSEPQNRREIESLCEVCNLPVEKVNYDLLRRTQQRKLEEFERGK